MTTVDRYNLFHSLFQDEAHSVYAIMREQDPVYLGVDWDGESPLWFITRYEDVKTVLRDHNRFVKDPLSVLSPDERPAPGPSYLEQLLHSEQPIPKPAQGMRVSGMVQADGAEHARLRKVVSKEFTPQRVEQMRGRIQATPLTWLPSLFFRHEKPYPLHGIYAKSAKAMGQKRRLIGIGSPSTVSGYP